MLRVDHDMIILLPTPFQPSQCWVQIKEGLYRIWCGVNTLGDSGVNTLSDTSAFVNPDGSAIVNPAG